MPFRLRLLILLLMLLITVGCDQATKQIARDQLPRGETIVLWEDTVRLHYSENSGAFLSAGAQLGETLRFAIFTLGVAVILAGLAAYLLVARGLTWAPVVAMALVIGGGLGNLIDRLLHDGAVVDFLNLGIGGLRTGIFNVADVFIVAGVLFLFVWSLFTSPEPEDDGSTRGDASGMT
jgi:signal peptidase II